MKNVIDLLSDEIGFCRESSERDAREVCGCFGSEVYHFIPGNSSMTGNPDAVMNWETAERVMRRVYVQQRDERNRRWEWFQGEQRVQDDKEGV